MMRRLRRFEWLFAIVIGCCVMAAALLPYFAMSVHAEAAKPYTFTIAETPDIEVNDNGTYNVSEWGVRGWDTLPFLNTYTAYLNNFRSHLMQNANVYNSYNFESGSYVPWALNEWSVKGNGDKVAGFGYAYRNRFYLRYVPSGAPTARQMDMITSLSVNRTVQNPFENFETTFAVRLMKDKGGAAILGFRQQTPGKFADSDAVLNREQAFVKVSRTGVTVAGGSGINDRYYDADQYAFDTALPDDTEVLKIHVRAVGEKVTVKVTDDADTVYFEKTETITYRTAGYFAYGISGPDRTNGLGEISLTHLDENGKAIALSDVAAGEETQGAHDPENTVSYTFEDAAQLDDFRSFYIPIAFTGYPLIDSAAHNEWFLRDGKLMRDKNAAYFRADSQMRAATGVEIEGHVYQCDWVYGWNANLSALQLKTQKYTNFEMSVSWYSSDSYWPIIGFGAGSSTEDAFCTQANGGYAVFVESEGKAKLWGYNAVYGNANNALLTKKLNGYTAAGVQHTLRLLVSDGVMYLYIDKEKEPILYTLPASYDGGYIYLATQSTEIQYDDLRVTDLDKKEIVLKSFDGCFADITVDRAAGETLTLPAAAQVTDKEGYAYLSPLVWDGGEYRSYKNGTFIFTGKPVLHNATVAEDATLSALTVKVTNAVGDAFDTETSLRYYFDSADDLKDFSTYASEKVGYDGKLSKTNWEQYWKIENGKLIRRPDKFATPFYDYNAENLQKKVSTLILDNRSDMAVNLRNFQLEVTYRHAADSWLWPMVAIGVNEPERYIKKQTGESEWSYAVTLAGGGVFVFTEQEGKMQAWGSISGAGTSFGAERESYGATLSDKNGKPFSQSFKRGEEHRMRIRVFNGAAHISVDDSEEMVANLDATAWGGYIGFAAFNAAVSYDDLTVTALDEDGNVTTLAMAQKGFAPSGEDTYGGWIPHEEDWFFSWDTEE